MKEEGGGGGGIVAWRLRNALNVLIFAHANTRVLNAQKAGYKAAIVHNVDSDDLISMGSNDLDVMKQIDIPSVFVSEETANSLKEDYTYDKGSRARIPLINYITKFVQDRHRARRSRLRKDQLKKLPIHKFKKGSVARSLGWLCLRAAPHSDSGFPPAAATVDLGLYREFRCPGNGLRGGVCAPWIMLSLDSGGFEQMQPQ
ncbi:hypothetical protein INR49_021437 [Caranx melampygus]|nr:hypothetical protein INR49_021437 [Caranx melampygus]